MFASERLADCEFGRKIAKNRDIVYVAALVAYKIHFLVSLKTVLARE